MQTDVAIIGGGLAGLALARRLEAAGTDYQLFEARRRFGGRIAALDVPGGAVDLGPSWFWPGQPRMAALLTDLGIASFAQHADGLACYEDASGAVRRGMGYASMAGSLRVAGGLSAVIAGLVASLPAKRLHLAAPVAALAMDGSVALPDGEVWRAQRMVLAVPPRIAAGLDYAPALPDTAQRAMRGIPTWMAGHAKFAAVYDTPFWRHAGLSGDAVSARGPLAEIHDASGMGGTPAALFGFVGVPAAQRHDRAEEIEHAALTQLARLFGEDARRPAATALVDWAREPRTATAADQILPRTHPLYGKPPALQALWDGRLILASSEMAHEAGGFMEGALAAAEEAAQVILG